MHDAANWIKVDFDHKRSKNYCLQASGVMGQSSLVKTTPGGIGTHFGGNIFLVYGTKCPEFIQGLLNVIIKMDHEHISRVMLRKVSIGPPLVILRSFLHYITSKLIPKFVLGWEKQSMHDQVRTFVFH
jgi:hypothetical protein